MNTEERKRQLKNKLEKELHTYMTTVREHTYDFVHLYVRRNNRTLNGKEVDLELLDEVLKVVRLGFNDGEASKLPFFTDAMDPALDSFLEKEKANEKPLLEQTKK